MEYKSEVVKEVKEIVVYFNGISNGLNKHCISCITEQEYIEVSSDLCRLAIEKMKESGKPHALYEVRKYDSNGRLYYVDFYKPPVCMDEEEFEKYTLEEYKKFPGCVICAVHQKVKPKKWQEG